MSQIGQVCAFGLVKLQRPGERVQHAVGDAVEVAQLEAGVVVDVDPGEHGDFLPAQPGNAPVAAVDRQAGLLRADLGPPGGQEIADLGPVVHDHDATSGLTGLGGSGSSCLRDEPVARCTAAIPPRPHDLNLDPPANIK